MEIEYNNTSSGWKYLDQLQLFFFNKIGLEYFIDH